MVQSPSCPQFKPSSQTSFPARFPPRSPHSRRVQPPSHVADSPVVSQSSTGVCLTPSPHEPTIFVQASQYTTGPSQTSGGLTTPSPHCGGSSAAQLSLQPKPGV